jgi:NAD dependent epimerase/dehydratase family enzyme
LSWIALDDVLGAIHHVWMNESLSGPINFVSPFPVRNEEFTETLARVLQRPAFLPMPEFAVKILFGEMGEELLLSGAKVEPKKLLGSGYPFLYPKLEQALKYLLK